MKAKKYQNLLGLLALLLVCAVFPITYVSAAGFDEKTTSSSATIDVFVEISLSTELGTGIDFGNLNPGTNDNNATQNYNASDMTEYWVTAGAANSVNIDVCIKDNQALTYLTDTIPNTGYTYNFSATNDATHPNLPGTAITTSYVKTGHTNIAPNAKSYSRYWLDVPGGQAAGTYTNTIYIKGIDTGTSC